MPPRAFTIIEVMAAGAMLLAIVTAIASGMLSIQTSYAHQRDLAVAESIAQRTLERLIPMPQTAPQLADGPHPAEGFSRDGHWQDGLDDSFFTTTVNITDQTPIPAMRRVAVTVAWSRGGREHQVRFVTDRE